MISFADRGHLLDSIHRGRGISKKQVKSFIIARWYVYNLTSIYEKTQT